MIRYIHEEHAGTGKTLGTPTCFTLGCMVVLLVISGDVVSKGPSFTDDNSKEL